MSDVINSNDRITVPVNDGDHQEVNGHTGGLLLMQEELAARDKRIEELEDLLVRMEAAKDTWRAEYYRLTADNTRLREALEKGFAFVAGEVYGFASDEDVVTATEAFDIMKAALAPQPEKEGK